MKPRPSLRRRLLQIMMVYAALLSLAIVGQGFFVNEHAEQLVWESLLQSELDHFLERSKADPGYRWQDTDSLALYGQQASVPLPPVLRGLPPGTHDEVEVDGALKVVLVREVDGHPLAMALDISGFEYNEERLGLLIVLSALALVALLAAAVAWAVQRLARPLDAQAGAHGGLEPDRSGQRVEVPPSASAELVVIADAVNGYLERNERFVERERAFIDSASHELRTPIAVIAGASELARAHPGVPAAARNQMDRIQRTARDVEQLISLLLALAKDPARLSGISDRVALDQLLREVIEDHRHLTVDKDLRLVTATFAACEIVAPLQIVQAAIGNLLRNAIENSDRGEIVIRLLPDATVMIEDPGHGMSPEEISAIYARVARGDPRGGGGIGLALIARLCEHLGWQLDIASDRGRGTRTTLKFGVPHGTGQESPGGSSVRPTA
jgi:signal transduction histidine kinase